MHPLYVVQRLARGADMQLDYIPPYPVRVGGGAVGDADGSIAPQQSAGTVAGFVLYERLTRGVRLTGLIGGNGLLCVPGRERHPPVRALSGVRRRGRVESGNKQTIFLYAMRISDYFGI